MCAAKELSSALEDSHLGCLGGQASSLSLRGLDTLAAMSWPVDRQDGRLPRQAGSLSSGTAQVSHAKQGPSTMVKPSLPEAQDFYQAWRLALGK